MKLHTSCRLEFCDRLQRNSTSTPILHDPTESRCWEIPQGIRLQESLNQLLIQDVPAANIGTGLVATTSGRATQIQC